MISSIVDGKVLDWNWKKLSHGYMFYVGSIYIGQVFNMGKTGWSCFYKTGNDIGLTYGFKNRYQASRFLLKLDDKLKGMY